MMSFFSDDTWHRFHELHNSPRVVEHSLECAGQFDIAEKLGDGLIENSLVAALRKFSPGEKPMRGRNKTFH